MVTLSHEAESHLERYLRQMRATLRGQRSVDPDDVERDVRSHIDAELDGRPEPIGTSDLRQVLEQLGAPNQWAPVDEQSPWQAIVSRLRYGPEDWRLAYLSLSLAALGVVLFIAGPVLWPVPVVLPIVAFFLARASVDLLAQHDEQIGARRWLIYPVLLPWSILLAALLLLWPLAPAVGAMTDFPEIVEWVADAVQGPTWAMEPLLGAVVLGIWWTCLGLILRRAPGAIRAAFRPFADEFDRRHAARMAMGGIFLIAAAGAALPAFTLASR
jgi:hypothetical protein